MAPDSKSYLATQIVAEKQSVTYRNVSRALKVHVNAAKCMLYDFYEQENKKRPDSIYATYLIAGIKKDDRAEALDTHKDDDGDVPIPSSPPPFTSSMLDPSQQSNHDARQPIAAPIRTISLIREEGLEDARQQYERITSIHIYSLSPGRLQDLVVLSDVGRDLFATTFVKEDPLQHNKMYGVIQNPLVRRRKGKRPVIPDAAPAKLKPVQSEKQADKESKTGPGVIPKEESRPSSRDSTSTAPSKPSGSQTKTSASQTKPASLKRDGSSLFKAFAKHSTKPKLDRKDSDASTSAPASQASDVKMADADADEEGESEDEALFLDTNTKKAASKKRPATDTKKQRDDKAAKLRKMMDSDDEAVNEVPTVDEAAGNEDKLTAPEDPATTKTSTQAKDEVDWSESDTEKPQTKKKEEPEEEISTALKRRRGKRKIMKKRTMKDEDGYLVTKEEPVWESFSEDEPEPVVKQKPKNAFGSIKSSNPSSSQKSTGSAAKAGAGGTKKKGDIMSFFGKK